MSKRKILDKELLFDLYVKQDKKQTEIADILGTTQARVSRYLIMYGIKKPPKLNVSREDLKTLYCDEEKSLEDIGKIYGVSRYIITNKLKEYGIKIKTQKEISAKRKMKGIGCRSQLSSGYVVLFYPTHPKSSKDGHIKEHRYIMEQHIGRYLRDDEEVHHINGIKNDNRIENLQLMTKSEHTSLHMRKRWKEYREKKNELQL